MHIYLFRLMLCILVLHIGMDQASAIDASIVSSTININYTEPTKLVDGRPITDLIFTTIKPVLKDSVGNSNLLPIIQIPASSSNGGGAIVQEFDVGTQGDFFIVEMVVTATRETGAESIDSPAVVVIVDRVPPSPPQ